ncbi:MAG: hypothetical protein ABJA83_11685 [Burkholderiaceae bacterium]
MYSTSNAIRISSAALAAIFGLGLVATAGGALHEERVTPAEMRLVKLGAVVVTPDASPRVAASCAQASKSTL